MVGGIDTHGGISTVLCDRATRTSAVAPAPARRFATRTTRTRLAWWTVTAISRGAAGTQVVRVIPKEGSK